MRKPCPSKSADVVRGVVGHHQDGRRVEAVDEQSRLVVERRIRRARAGPSSCARGPTRPRPRAAAPATVGIVDRLEEAEERGLLVVEGVVVAVQDRGDAADVPPAAAARRRAASRRAGRTGSRPGRPSRRRRAGARPSSGRPRRWRSATSKKRDRSALAAADALDRRRPKARSLNDVPLCDRASSGVRGPDEADLAADLLDRVEGARQRCSRVCVAMSDVRISARPGGVAGDRTQLTKTPSSWRRWTMRSAVRSSPTTTGTTGLFDSPVSRPRDRRPSAKKRVFSQSRSRRSGSRVHDLDGRQGGRGRGRRRRRREDQRAGAVLDVVDDRRVAGDEAADRGHRLRERPHDQVDVVLEAEVLGRAAPGLAEDADAVRVVHHDAGRELARRPRRSRAGARCRPPSRRRRRRRRAGPRASLSARIWRRRSAGSLCLNFLTSPKESRAPSMMQAWSCLSR